MSVCVYLCMYICLYHSEGFSGMASQKDTCGLHCSVCLFGLIFFIILTSTEEVIFWVQFVGLFVSRITKKTVGLTFIRLGGKGEHGPRKNTLYC